MRIVMAFSMCSTGRPANFCARRKLIDNVTWASGIDDKGRPIAIPGKDPTPEGNWVCPSVKGATNWMGQSYQSGHGAVVRAHAGAVRHVQQFFEDAGADEELRRRGSDGGGRPGDSAGYRSEDGQTCLGISDDGVWPHVDRHGLDRRRVVFTGDDDGHLVALDAKSGKDLWYFNMGETLTASPITYQVDGKQYVAIASATAIFSFGLFEPSQHIPLPKVTVRK